MSIESISWALNLEDDRLTAVDRLVLIGVANHDGDGGAWPAIATLARYAGVAPRSVSRSISRLADFGLLVRHQQQGGNTRTRPDQRPNLYELVKTREDTTVTPSDERDDTPVTPRDDTPVTPPLTDRSPEPSFEPSTEPSNATDTSVSAFSDVVLGLCDLLAHHIGEWSPDGKRPTIGKQWHADMDRMIRIDGREPMKIASVIRWLFTSPDSVATFWAPNVQSPKKLRAKWTVMEAQHRRLTDKPAHQSAIQQSLNAIRERDIS